MECTVNLGTLLLLGIYLLLLWFLVGFVHISTRIYLYPVCYNILLVFINAKIISLNGEQLKLFLIKNSFVMHLNCDIEIVYRAYGIYSIIRMVKSHRLIVKLIIAWIIAFYKRNSVPRILPKTIIQIIFSKSTSYFNLSNNFRFFSLRYNELSFFESFKLKQR